MRLFFVIFFCMIIATEVCGQSRADRNFERGDYWDAVKLYEKQLENMNGEDSEKRELLKMRIAYCFFNLNDMPQAGDMYKRVNPDLLRAEDLTYYAITLVHTGDYRKARGLLALAEALGADPIVLERIKNTCDFAAEMLKLDPIYSAKKTEINLGGMSSGSAYYKGKNLVLAARNMGDDITKDRQGYIMTRLHQAIFTGDGTNGRLLPFADELTEKYHIGSVTFTSDYKRIYYTTTILKNDGTTIFKLMTAEEERGKWGRIKELDINSDDYSCVHPSLYKDSLLIFVSDMPGGFGGKDLYAVEVRGAECGEIRNLGGQINTANDELFPFIANDGKLYFASDGHIGLGGLDVFISQINENGEWTYPQNMGRPINSSMDDFSLVFRNTDCTDGYVSSNRGGSSDFLFSIKLLSTRQKNKPTLAKIEQQSKTVRQMQVAGHPVSQEVQLPIRQEVVEKVKDPIKKVVQQEMSKDELFDIDYQYAIQIGAFRNPVPRVYFEHLRNVKVYLGYDHIYRYAVGEYPDKQLAKIDLQHVKKEVKDAFVMGVGPYIADKKIQNDTKGDKISDDELLLRRLKNFEKQGVLLNKKQKLPPRTRVLDKPKNAEIQSSKTYTVVLMSADKIFNPNKLSGIRNIDVLAISKGKYMYCAGMFSTVEEAASELDKVRSMGFDQSYVLRRERGVFYSQSLPPKTLSRNIADLKTILNF